MTSSSKHKLMRLAGTIALAGALILGATPALAQGAAGNNASATSTQTREEVRAELRAKSLQHVYEVARRIVGRLQAAINRLAKIADRLSSRIQKIKATGVDTTNAEAKLTIATNAILTAKGSWDNLNNSFANAFNASTTRENMKKARDLIAPTVKAIRDAHKALVDALKATRAATGSTNNPGNATSTASSTNANN